MSDPTHLELPGVAVPRGELQIPKAVELAAVLESRALSFVELAEVRRAGAAEIVVLRVQPEIPQRRANDIRRSELIAVEFSANEKVPPAVFSLRADFPDDVPHLNLVDPGSPRSLCLSDEPFVEQALTWTASKLLRQLHRWLSLTARGELHEPDQPLEPFILSNASPLVLPSEFFESGSDLTGVDLDVSGREVDDGRLSLVAYRAGTRPFASGLPFVSLVLDGVARPHGAVRERPRDLAELHEMLAEAGIDLVGALASKAIEWRIRDDRDRVRVLLVVRLPKTRVPGGEVEETEVWGFLAVETLGALAEALGVMVEGVPLVGATRAAADNASKIRLHILNPMPLLTRDAARALNGIEQCGDLRIVAVGAGALGSQVLMNLARTGWGVWTIIDDDVLLPHNVARHALGTYEVGFAKAAALHASVDSLYDGGSGGRFHVQNVLSNDATVAAEFDEAHVVLDMAASVAVSRKLSRELGGGRRIALFLNPTGEDLVLLAEDSARHHRLDELEMTYYRELVLDADLADHLAMQPSRIRYANSCRDVSSRVSQEAVAVLAGIGARAVRMAAIDPEASISMWRTDHHLGVHRRVIQVSQTQAITRGHWTIVVDEVARAAMRELRARRLPNETGGVLYGARDLSRGIIYVVGMIPSPRDSTEWPMLYIRGAEGLKAEVDRIERVTGGALGYLGEWHSHPDGTSVDPSTDDRTVFDWLASHLVPDGYPPLMSIVGQHGEAWFAGEI